MQNPGFLFLTSYSPVVPGGYKKMQDVYQSSLTEKENYGNLQKQWLVWQKRQDGFYLQELDEKPGIP
jgi:hypothetical protein